MMRPLVAIAFALLLVAAGPATARDGRGGGRGGSAPRSSFSGHGAPRHGWHGGHHGHHHHHHFGGSGIFFYGSYGPYWYPGWGWYRPYFYPYYPYYPVYSYPPPWAREPDDDEDDDERADVPAPDEMEQASYGLLKLDGVRDGAAVELDGRFWLTARDLDDRWLALPQGEHRIAVRVGEGELIERTVRIVPGRTHVLKFDAEAERRT